MMFHLATPARATVCALLAILAAWGAESATLSSGPEAELSVPVIGPAEGAQVDVRATFDGTNYLAVWRDFRAGWAEIWGAHVGPDGAVLDPAGFRIGTYADGKLACDVAFGGGVYLVAWRGRSGQSVVHRIVSTDGAPLSSESSESTVAPHDDGPKVASNDTRFLVLAPATPAIALLVRRDGSVDRRIAIPGLNASRSAVAGAGDRFLIASRDSLGVNVSELSNDGTVRSLASIPKAEWTPQRVLLAARGNDWTVAWNEPSYSGIDLFKSPVYLVRAPGGVPAPRLTVIADSAAVDDIAMAMRDDGGIELAWGTSPYAPPGARALRSLVLDSTGGGAEPATVVDGALEWEAQPAVASDGARFAIFWANRQGLRRNVGDLTPDGVFPQTAAPQRDAAVVPLPDGSGTLVAWGEPVVGRGRLLAAVRPSSAGAQPTERVLREWVSPVVHPAAAASDEIVFLAWYEVEQRELATLILGMRLDRSGAQLDPEPLPISIMSATDYGMPAHPPAVVWTGSVFVVAWTDSSGQLLTRRFLPSGESIDGQPRPVATQRTAEGQVAPQIAPAAARNGDVSLLVWQDGVPFSECYTLCVPSAPGAEILGVRLNAAGDAIDAGARFVSRSTFTLRPAVTAGHGRFLVAWTRQQAGAGSSSGDEGTTAGVLLESDGSFGSGEITVSDSSLRQSRSSVTTFSEGFVVAWSDRRRGPAGYASEPEMTDVLASMLDVNGSLLSANLRIQADEHTQASSDLVPLGGNRILAVYERVLPDPPHTGVRRFFAREMTFSESRRRPVRRATD